MPQSSTLPDGASEQLIVRIAVIKEGHGGCTVSVDHAPDAALVAKYGGVAPALAACRDFIVGDLDFIIAELKADGV